MCGEEMESAGEEEEKDVAAYVQCTVHVTKLVHRPVYCTASKRDESRNYIEVYEGCHTYKKKSLDNFKKAVKGK